MEGVWVPVEGNYHDTPVKMHRNTRRLCELIIFLSQIEGMAPSDANALERLAESLEQPQTHDSLRELTRWVLKQFPPRSIPPTLEGLQVWYMTYAFASTVEGWWDLTGLFSQLCGQLATECGGRMQHKVIYPPEPLKDVDQIHWARVQQAASIFQSLLSEWSDDDLVWVKYVEGRRSWQPNDQLEPDFMLSRGVELQPVDARQLTPLEVARVRANMDRGDWDWLPGLKDAVHAAVAALDAANDHAG